MPIISVWEWANDDNQGPAFELKKDTRIWYYWSMLKPKSKKMLQVTVDMMEVKIPKLHYDAIDIPISREIYREILGLKKLYVSGSSSKDPRWR